MNTTHVCTSQAIAGARLATAACAVLLAADVVRAGELDSLDEEIAAVRQERRTVMIAAAATPEVKTAQAAAERAEAEYDAALKNLPGMRAVVVRIEEARAALRAAELDRATILHANEMEVERLGAIREAARVAASAAAQGGARGRALKERQVALMRRKAELTSPPPPEMDPLPDDPAQP